MENLLQVLFKKGIYGIELTNEMLMIKTEDQTINFKYDFETQEIFTDLVFNSLSALDLELIVDITNTIKNYKQELTNFYKKL